MASLILLDSYSFLIYSILNLLIGPILLLLGGVLYKKKEGSIDFTNYVGLWSYILLLLSLYLGVSPNFGLLADVKISEIYNWPLLSFHISAFSLPFLMLLHLVTVITILVYKSSNSSWVEKKWEMVMEKRERNKLLFSWLVLLLHLILYSFFTSTNFITFYVTFEASMIPLFLLIFLFGKRKERITAAYYLFFYTLFSSILFLIGIGLIISWEGTSSFLTLNFNAFGGWSERTQLYGFIGFFLAFAVKLPMLPFHIWLPEAHVEASTEGSVLLAALLLKISAYGIITILFQFFPFGCLYFKPVVIGLGLISLIYICFSIYRQLDLKKIIAYTSIAHMNLALLGFFTFTVEGFYGAYSLMIVHGLVSSGLFILVGFLYIRFHTRALYYYSGLNNILPRWSFMFFVFTLGNCSFPFTAAFLPEMLIYMSIFENYIWVGLISLCSAFLLVVASLLTYVRLTTGIISKNVMGSISKRGREVISIPLDLTSLEREIIGGLLILVLLLFFLPSILYQIPLIKVLQGLIPLHYV